MLFLRRERRPGAEGDDLTGHNPPNKFGIVTLTQNSELYNRMDDIKREQYAGRPHMFVYNEPKDRPTRDNDLIFRSRGVHPTGAPMMIEKFIYFLRNFIDRPQWADCSHIVRANASTFLNLPLLEAQIARLPRTGCYAGSIVFDSFVSGTCIVFSRDTAMSLVKSYRRYLAWQKRKKEDDLVIAKVMRWARTPMTNIPMTFLTDGAVPGDDEIESILQKYPLIRVRSERDRELTDIAIWESLYRVYRQQEPMG